MINKIVSLLLVAVMLFSVVPFKLNVSALDAEGQCGDNAYWTFDEESGELTISGEGSLWSTYIKVSFHSEKAIKSVTICEGITGLGSYLFWGCENLAEITVPDSLNYIEKDVFYGTAFYNNESNWDDGALYLDNHLLKVRENVEIYEIRDNTELIADYAFGEDSAITAVTVPGSVTEIGEYVFYKCENLKDVVLEEGIEEIGFYAFSYCTSLEEITLPDSLKSLNGGAFIGCESLKSITIPDGTTYIGNSAFYDCESLADITVPDSVVCIGTQAFEDTAYMNNSFNWVDYEQLYVGNHLIAVKGNREAYTVKEGTLTIGGGIFEYNEYITSINIPDGIVGIGPYAFWHCENLTEVILPESLRFLGNYAFDDCKNLESIEIPDGVEEIGTHTFAYNEKLTSITLPKELKQIGFAAFVRCKSLTDIYYGGTTDEWKSIEIEDENDCLKDATVHCSDGDLITRFTASDFNCEIDFSTETVSVIGYIGDSSDIEIPDELDGYTVSGIGKNAFYNRENILSIEIPDSVTFIGEYAFFGCENLESIDIPLNVTSIGDFAFYECKKLETIEIPDGVTSLGISVFWGCENLKTAIIPESVISLEQSTFNGCGSLTDVYYSGTKSQWKSIDINYESEELLNATIHCSDGDIVPGAEETTEASSSTTEPTTVPVTEEKETITAKPVESTTTKKEEPTTKAPVTIKVPTTVAPTTATPTPTTTEKEEQPTVKAQKPAKPKIKKPKSTKKKQIVVTWNKVKTVNGYQIAYSTSKKFQKKSTKTKLIKKAKTTKTTLKKLKSGKKYFIKVRAYKTVNGKKVYGAYSKVMSVKVK